MKELIIHFDLNNGKHDIPISQSITIEKSIKTIIEEFNKIVFNGQLEINITVDPSENGGHIKRIIINIITIIGGLIGGNIINGIVMGIGDGRDIEEYSRDFIAYAKENFPKIIQGFLSKENSVLEEKGIDKSKYYKAYLSKNKFYESALSNPDIRGLGFSNQHIFPILKPQFSSRISDLDSKSTGLEPIERYHELIVVSAINTIENKSLIWQVKDINLKSRFSAYMVDEEFYDFFLENNIYLKTLVVKIKYFLKRNEEGNIEIAKKDMVKVYKYNDIERIILPEGIEITTAPLDLDGNGVDIHIVSDIPHIEGPTQQSLF